MRFSPALLVWLAILPWCHGNRLPTKFSFPITKVPKDYNTRKILHGTAEVLERSPSALIQSLKRAIPAFFSNSMLMIPLCLVFGLFQKPSSRNEWFNKGLVSGIQFSSISTAYTGIEDFLKFSRLKDDKWSLLNDDLSFSSK